MPMSFKSVRCIKMEAKQNNKQIMQVVKCNKRHVWITAPQLNWPTFWTSRLVAESWVRLHAHLQRFCQSPPEFRVGSFAATLHPRTCDALSLPR